MLASLGWGVGGLDGIVVPRGTLCMSGVEAATLVDLLSAPFLFLPGCFPSSVLLTAFCSLLLQPSLSPSTPRLVHCVLY